jgi:hypothetical protein
LAEQEEETTRMGVDWYGASVSQRYLLSWSTHGTNLRLVDLRDT